MDDEERKQFLKDRLNIYCNILMNSKNINSAVCGHDGCVYILDRIFEIQKSKFDEADE